jgi:hypothetical protein
MILTSDSSLPSIPALILFLCPAALSDPDTYMLQQLRMEQHIALQRAVAVEKAQLTDVTRVQVKERWCGRANGNKLMQAVHD